MAQGAQTETPRHVAPTSRPIGYWLKLVDQLVDEQFEDALSEFGVSRRQWELLNLLSPGPASLLRLNEAIEPFLDPDASESASHHLSGLIDRGWVDVAFEYYELTGAGASHHADLHRLVARKRAAALVDVSEADYATTVAVLEKVALTLGWNG